MEDCMLDTMYDTPSNSAIRKIIITKDAILKKSKPIIITDEEKSA